jgi:hypothetical protein
MAWQMAWRHGYLTTDRQGVFGSFQSGMILIIGSKSSDAGTKITDRRTGCLKYMSLS